jgi:4-diphosphocytidyl-2-C-methyl-D-erythritol kinase
MAAQTIAIAAAAKVNLYLHVTGRRDDGYHELDSLVAFAAVHDTLLLTPSPRIELVLGGPFAAALDGAGDNLVLTAARRLAEQTGTTAGARIELVKRLPVAAGIGGGSADAAAALHGLRRLWKVDLADDDWQSLALGLGADVPICFHGQAAFVGGIGERIDPAPHLPAVPMVMVNPGIAVPTPAVFARRAGPFSAAAGFAASVATAVELVDFLAARGNDLFAPACDLAPAIGEAVEHLQSAPDCLLARMSGSGATCFGLFAGAEAATAAAASLRADHPAWWVAETRLLTDTADLDADPAKA